MPDKIIEVSPEKCVGCRICEQWCSYSHQQVVSPSTTRIRVQRLYSQFKNIPVVCRQCGRPACVEACKFDALSRDSATGAVITHEEKCMGCRLCIKACPYGAVNYDASTKLVRICDLCKGAPQCVAHCPEGALDFIGEDSAVNQYRHKVAERCGR